MATNQAANPSSIVSKFKCNIIINTITRIGLKDAKWDLGSKGIHHRVSAARTCRLEAANSAFLLLLLCLTSASVLKLAKFNATASFADPRSSSSKPPRGYCTQISRAVSPDSRCYKHLLGPLNTGNGNQEPITSEPNLGEAPLAALKLHEELVYVRLETFGSNIRQLNTRAINERLVMGVFNFLLGKEAQTSGKGNNEDSNNNKLGASNNGSSSDSNLLVADAALRDIRAQISGSPPGSEGRRLAEKCQMAIERFICRLAYPTCHFRRADVSALVRPPCREDCLILRDVLCASLDWPKFNQVLSRAFNATLMSAINALDLEVQGYNLNYSISNHFYWPHEHSIMRCESLPPLRFGHSLIGGHNLEATPRRILPKTESHDKSETGRRRFRRHIKWPTCSDARLTRASLIASSESQQFNLERSKPTEMGDECLTTSDGINYRGTQNVTRSGIACQAWQSQEPHQHTSSELLFENMRRAHNYCRNPGGTELKPWCYTQEEGVRWEYCMIKKC